MNPRISLGIIVACALLAFAFIYSGLWGAAWRPWRLGLDLVGGSHLVYEVDTSQIEREDLNFVLPGLRDVIERRVNLFGVSEPQVFLAESGGRSRLIVELAGVHNISEAVKIIGETPFLDFREVEGSGTSTRFIQTNLTGRYITGASLVLNPTTQTPQASISFSSEGADIFEKLTEANIGKPIAIFLDNVLIEMPVVQEKIHGGEAVITGQFTPEEAKQLVERFNAGALPAPIVLVDQLTISPGLGANSLLKAAVAGVVGTILVVIFMIGYYRGLGVFASLALLIYIVFALAVFKLISVTLTLSGLAGFILTIGMAVDANILIFERMKEEVGRGLSRMSATTEGFRRAWPSIRDSNTATILSAIILYLFTSSFVKGFALTLLLGTFVSMFSAITTTRILLRAFMKSNRT